MVIIGARGFATELLTVLSWNSNKDHLFVFDDYYQDAPDTLYGLFPVLKSWSALQNHFLIESPDFVLGIGGASLRMRLAEKAINSGGRLCSIISNHALIGEFGNFISDGDRK